MRYRCFEYQETSPYLRIPEKDILNLYLFEILEKPVGISVFAILRTISGQHSWNCNTQIQFKQTIFFSPSTEPLCKGML